MFRAILVTSLALFLSCSTTGGKVDHPNVNVVESKDEVVKLERRICTSGEGGMYVEVSIPFDEEILKVDFINSDIAIVTETSDGLKIKCYKVSGTKYVLKYVILK